MQTTRNFFEKHVIILSNPKKIWLFVEESARKKHSFTRFERDFCLSCCLLLSSSSFMLYDILRGPNCTGKSALNIPTENSFICWSAPNAGNLRVFCSNSKFKCVNVSVPKTKNDEYTNLLQL